MSSVGGLVMSNRFNSFQASALQAVLNTTSAPWFVRLFQNDITVDPTLNLSDFVECSFPGYTPINTAGNWPKPVQIATGEYQLAYPASKFTCKSLPEQTAYGLYLSNGTDWSFGQTFTTPVLFGPGLSYTLVLYVQNWALSVVTCP